jgi:hypothetical protein
VPVGPSIDLQLEAEARGPWGLSDTVNSIIPTARASPSCASGKGYGGGGLSYGVYITATARIRTPAGACTRCCKFSLSLSFTAMYSRISDNQISPDRLIHHPSVILSCHPFRPTASRRPFTPSPWWPSDHWHAVCSVHSRFNFKFQFTSMAVRLSSRPSVPFTTRCIAIMDTSSTVQVRSTAWPSVHAVRSVVRSRRPFGRPFTPSVRSSVRTVRLVRSVRSICHIYPSYLSLFTVTYDLNRAA